MATSEQDRRLDEYARNAAGETRRCRLEQSDWAAYEASQHDVDDAERLAFEAGWLARDARAAPPPAPPVGGGEANIGEPQDGWTPEPAAGSPPGDAAREWPNARAIFHQLVDAERSIQDEEWGGPDHDDCHIATEWAAFVEKQCRAAAASMDPQEQRARFVKVGALAAAVFESITRKLRGRDGGHARLPIERAPASPPPEGRSGGAETEPSVREWRVVQNIALPGGERADLNPWNARDETDARAVLETLVRPGRNPRIEYRDVGPWTALAESSTEEKRDG